MLDYADVFFRLKPDDIMLGYEIYLYGEFTDFRLNEDFKMKLDAETGIYYHKAFLKQGLYSYQYVVKSIYSDKPDEGMIEGSHFDTENRYQVFVYYSNPFEGYDQLIGIEHLNSRTDYKTIYQD